MERIKNSVYILAEAGPEREKGERGREVVLHRLLYQSRCMTLSITDGPRKSQEIDTPILRLGKGGGKTGETRFLLNLPILGPDC